MISSGEIDIRRFRLKHYYKAQLTLRCENPLEMIEQYYEYIAVIDFEATCHANQGNNFPHEIIEFPIVLIDVKQQMIVIKNYCYFLRKKNPRFFSFKVDKFQSYCRPTRNPILSNFCRELTGIEQVCIPRKSGIDSTRVGCFNTLYSIRDKRS